MILRVHVPGAFAYPVGDEIWHRPLAEVIAEQASVIAADVGGDVLELPRHGDLLRAVIREMTLALVSAGDRYRSRDGVLYSLAEERADLDTVRRADSLAAMSASSPVVEEVLRFEDLPLGTMASRRAIVRWSDGTEGEAVRYYSDEVLICEGDLVGKSREEIRSLHFRRDRDRLQF
jgi:hypothetical protein